MPAIPAARVRSEARNGRLLERPDRLHVAAPPELVPLRPWQGASSFEAASAAKSLRPKRLASEIASLSRSEIAEAIRATESSARASPIDPALANARVGETWNVSADLLRPGQVQLSLSNVRRKMASFVERLGDAPSKHAPTLFADDEAMTAVVGPGGQYLVLTDGHHHVAALKALQALVQPRIGEARGGKEVRRVYPLFGGPGESPRVPIRIVGNGSELSEAEFWAHMRGEVDGRPRVYLHDSCGTTHTVPPRFFGELEDNPFRYLAALITGKVALRKGGRHPALRGAATPVWLKHADHAPPFIEFRIARILREAFRRAGLIYDPEAPLSARALSIARLALLDAKRNPFHPAADDLASIVVLSKDFSAKETAKALSVDSSGERLQLPRSFTKASKRRRQRLREVAEGREPAA